MTADCRDDKDIKKQYMRQNAVGNMPVRKFSFAPIEAKIQLFKSYCQPIYGCALWHHSYQNSIRKLTVSFSETFKRLINVPRYTSSSLAFATNLTDHINVCVPQICLQPDEQSNSLSQQYCVCHCQQPCLSSVSTVRQVGEYAICLGIIVDIIISQYVNV